MSDEIRISGLDDVIGKVTRQTADLDRAIEIAIRKVSTSLERTIKKGLTTQQALKKPGADGRTHVGANGGFPNRRTGNLASSINTDMSRKGFGTYEAKVAPGQTYGIYLELGFTSKAGNRWRYPYMAPAAQYARLYARQIFLSEMKKVWK